MTGRSTAPSWCRPTRSRKRWKRSIRRRRSSPSSGGRLEALPGGAARLFLRPRLRPDLAIAPFGFEHVVARDRQRPALADVLHLVIAGGAVLEHHAPAGEIEFPHAE